MNFKEFYTDYMNKKPTEEMVKHYHTRTTKHIENVRFFMKKLVGKYPELEQRMEDHDKSKFSEPELTPYIFITWKYYCASKDDLEFEDFNPPEDIGDLMNQATHHHVTTNSHHPEFHSPDQEELINRDDRDKPPSKMVDATAMPDIDLVEMCCDWSGMGKELGTNPKEWAKNNVNVRWEFTEKQAKFIDEILDEIWEES